MDPEISIGGRHIRLQTQLWECGGGFCWDRVPGPCTDNPRFLSDMQTALEGNATIVTVTFEGDHWKWFRDVFWRFGVIFSRLQYYQTHPRIDILRGFWCTRPSREWSLNSNLVLQWLKIFLVVMKTIPVVIMGAGDHGSSPSTAESTIQSKSLYLKSLYQSNEECWILWRCRQVRWTILQTDSGNRSNLNPQRIILH